MKKRLLLSLASPFLSLFLILSESSPAAEPVYSQNVVGWYKVQLPAGFSMIANQLNYSDNSLNAILNSVPLGSQILKWDPAIQSFSGSIDYFGPAFGGWVDPLTLTPTEVTLHPGEGAFINLPEATTLTFRGEVTQGLHLFCISPLFSIVGHPLPSSQSAPWNHPLFQPTVGDQLLYWDNSSQSFTATVDYFGPAFGGWIDAMTFTPVNPTVAIGESVFYNSALGFDNCAGLFFSMD